MQVEMEEGYGPCLSCKKPTPIIPATQVENGLICTHCRLKDRPCKPAYATPLGQAFPDLAKHLPGGTDWHNPLCPKSQDFDRRKTRQNWAFCLPASAGVQA